MLWLEVVPLLEAVPLLGGANGGLAISSLTLLLFAPILLLGADYLFDELLHVKEELRVARHYRAFLYLAVIAVSLMVIIRSRDTYSYLETFQVTTTSLFWILSALLLSFLVGKWILRQSWLAREKKRIESLDLELPQYLEMFHILITSGMSVLSALKVLSQSNSVLSFNKEGATEFPLHSPSQARALKVSAGLGAGLGAGITQGNALVPAQVVLGKVHGFSKMRAAMSSHGNRDRGSKRVSSMRPFGISTKSTSEMKLVIREVLAGVEEGMAIERALDQAVIRSRSEQLRRFSDAVILGMERGSSMGQTLRNLITETRNQSKVLIMQRAGKAEIQLLIPVVFLILPISVMFAIWPSYVNLASIMGG